jgi:transcriptional regulator with XRE-family HTH domain
LIKQYDYKKIFSLRQQKGWTKEMLAHHVGVSPYIITRLEEGKPCKPETLLKLASALGVSKELLLGETGGAGADPAAMAEFNAWCEDKGFKSDKYLTLAMWLLRHLSPSSLATAMTAMKDNKAVEFNLSLSDPSAPESTEEQEAFETVMDEVQKAEARHGKRRKDVG